MTKIYRVLVVYESSGDMYVEADSIAQARERSDAILREGRETVDVDQFASDSHLDDIRELDANELERMESLHRKNLEENMEALKEISAE